MKERFIFIIKILIFLVITFSIIWFAVDWRKAYKRESARLIQEIHIVKRGETLSHISSRHRVSIQKIRKFNGFPADREDLFIGQTLLIPKKREKTFWREDFDSVVLEPKPIFL